MAASLHLRSLTVFRGPKIVLDDVTLTLSPRQRVGLIGPNGVGKTTLMTAMAGRLEPDAGDVTRAPATATVGLLPQEPERSRTETVREFLDRRTGVAVATAELEEATLALSNQVPGSDDLYSDSFERWMQLGSADLDARIGEVWSDLGLTTRLLDQPTASLSGGEAARSSLASILLSRFDIFLLDEPSNDLDLEGLDHLERWMTTTEAPLMMVSHDRRLLERTVTDIVEIDFHTHRVQHFGGGWQAYITEQQRQRDLAERRFGEFETQSQRLADRAQQQREWASQGQSKVRSSSENDKHVKNFKMDQTEKLAGKAAQTKRAIDRLEKVEKPRVPWNLQLELPHAPRSGHEVAWAAEAVVQRASFQLGPVDLNIVHGDRIALVGPNGSGKTTLIHLLLGRIEPTSGTAGVGPSVVVGEIQQARKDLAPQDLLGLAMENATGQTIEETRTLLAKFGLHADHVGRTVESLSPGERTRAGLALLMARHTNFLVLDEPTNHLDIEAIEQLEQALDTYGGTVVLVTHDRELLANVRTTRTLVVDSGIVTEP